MDILVVINAQLQRLFDLYSRGYLHVDQYVGMTQVLQDTLVKVSSKVGNKGCTDKDCTNTDKHSQMA